MDAAAAFRPFPPAAVALSFSPDSRKLAVGIGSWFPSQAACSAYVWDCRDGALAATLPHDGSIRSLRWLQGGQRLVTAAESRSDRWQPFRYRQTLALPSTELLRIVEVYPSFAVNERDNEILTGGEDVLAWELSDEVHATFPEGVSSWCGALSGCILIVGSGRTVQLWNIEEGRRVRQWAEDSDVQQLLSDNQNGRWLIVRTASNVFVRSLDVRR